MIKYYAYFCFMKTRLNITIEDALLPHIKEYAASREVSISQMVEDYFRSLVKPNIRKKNIIEMVDELEAPSHIDNELDLKKSYYEQNSKKYGF